MQVFLKQTLDDYFNKDEILTHQIFEELSLYIYSLESKDTDLYMLAKLLDKDSLQKLIAYYDGDILKIPSHENYKTCILTALCFWLKTFKGYTWTEIKDYLNIPENNKDLLSSISIGGKINKVKDNLGSDLIKMLEKVEEKDFVAFYKEKHKEIYEKENV